MDECQTATHLIFILFSSWAENILLPFNEKQTVRQEVLLKSLTNNCFYSKSGAKETSVLLSMQTESKEIDI